MDCGFYVLEIFSKSKTQLRISDLSKVLYTLHRT